MDDTDSQRWSFARVIHDWLRLRLVRVSITLAAVFAMGGLIAILGGGTSSAATLDEFPLAFTATLPKAACRATDLAETGLAGEVPLVDRASGRAARGYNCNTDEIARVRGPKGIAGANLEMYDHCLYWGDTIFGPPGGTVVVDIQDPKNPVQTGYLTTSAMRAPWESLRANAARGLLVANSNGSGAFDVYDVKTNCADPRLLSSVTFATARGHEGWFQPDGMVYYSGGRVSTNKAHPINLTDPANPVEMAHLAYATTAGAGIHGGSTSLDGKVGYFCNAARSPNDSVVIVDTREIQARKANPNAPSVSRIQLQDSTECQSTDPLVYKGKHYLVVTAEGRARPDCSTPGNGYATFSTPKIYNIEDPDHPVLVSRMMLEINAPENCARAAANQSTPGVISSMFGTAVHMCSPDRLINPTILACGHFLAGLRVFDIRNPAKPQEIAYHNVVTPTTGMDNGAASRPIVSTERGQIYFAVETVGLVAIQLDPRVWPFADMTCPDKGDFYYWQYNKAAPKGCKAI